MTDGSVDARLLGKPQRFKGDEDRWEDWSFTMRAYATTLGPSDEDWDAPGWMDGAEAHATEVRNIDLGTKVREFSTQLYFILAMLLDGPAMVTVKRVPRAAGLEAWRQLVGRYEKPVAGRVHALLQEILHPRPFPQSSMEFETSLGGVGGEDQQVGDAFH